MAEPESQNTAPRSIGPDQSGHLQARQVKQRIDALPALDMVRRMGGLSDLLHDANRTLLALDSQQALLDLIDPEIRDILAGYQAQAHHYAHPLSEQHLALYLRLQTLLSHAGLAYKRLVQDLLKQVSSESSQPELRNAIMQCIDYLTQQALQAYAVYRDAPSSIWKDLHQLYAYAEKKQLATEVVEHLSDLSISGMYARALLLCLANPAHLLQGEIYQAYEKLGKWGLAVRFEHPQELPPAPLHELLIDRYFCDLEGDTPPDFGSADMPELPVQPRLLNLKEVLNIINSRMRKLALGMGRSLALRAEWDLLLRLRHSWERRPARQESRKPECGTTVKAVVSLSSCHYFFSGYTPFEPEKSEINLHGENFQQSASLSLMSLDSTPWLDADTATKLETGVIKPRSYSFDLENRENDVWKKSHLTTRQEETRIEKVVEERMLETIYAFRLVNTSGGGDGLETMPDSTVQLRVGELLALFPHDEEADGDPVLNAVRWIQSDPDLTLRIGVRRIHGTSEAVAVRALDDKAIYRDYVRAFLIEDGEDSSVIVPAGQFESKTTLVVNNDENLQLYRLENLIESTRAFSRYKYKPLELDRQASEAVVNSLKRLLHEDEN